MNTNDILADWSKKDKRTLAHKTLPNTCIKLSEPHPYLRHNPRRFHVMVRGRWVTDYNGQSGPITDFKTIEAAINKANELIAN